MKPILLASLLITAAGMLARCDSASAAGRARQARRASAYAWHGSNYHAAWGTPVALVVPPTAESQTHWGRGVGSTRKTRIWHQFGRNYPGPVEVAPGTFQPTPRWPGSTDQFGVYYIRGPW